MIFNLASKDNIVIDNNLFNKTLQRCMALFSLTGAHVPACACCGVRGPVAEALDRLFLGRVRGEFPWFTAIAALPQSPEATEAIRQTLRNDAASSARFRLAN